MGPEARDLLERYRQTQTLDAPRIERMSDALHQRLARGMGALPGIDASPILLPRASWLDKLPGALISKAGPGMIALLTLGAGLAALRFLPVAQPGNVMSEPPAALAAEIVAQPAESPGTAAPPAQSVPPSAATVLPATGGQVRPRLRETRVRGRRGGDGPGGGRASEPVEPAGTRQEVATETSRHEGQVSDGPRRSEQQASEPRAERPVREPSRGETAIGSELDIELSLLRKAYAALNEQRAADALTLLDEHMARFPHGQLSESREVAMMLALCASGRVRAAQVRAQRFLAAHPNSAFARRARGICPRAQGQ